MALPSEYQSRPLTPEEEAALLVAAGTAAPPTQTLEYPTAGPQGNATPPPPPTTIPVAAPAPEYVAAPPADGASQYYGGTTGGAAGSSLSNPDLISTIYPASGAPAVGLEGVSTGRTGQVLRYDDTSMYSAAPLPASASAPAVGNGSRTQTRPGALTPTMDWASGVGATIDSLFPSAGASPSPNARPPAVGNWSPTSTMTPGEQAPGGRRYQARPGALNPTIPSGDFVKGEAGRLLGLDPDRQDLDMYNQFVLNTRDKLGDVGQGVLQLGQGAANLVTTPLGIIRDAWNPGAPQTPLNAPLKENWETLEDVVGPWGMYPRGAQEATQKYVTNPVAGAVTGVKNLLGSTKDAVMDEPTKAWQSGVGEYFDRSFEEQRAAIDAGKTPPGETNRLAASEHAATAAVDRVNKLALNIPTEAELSEMSLDALRAVMSDPRTPDTLKQKAGVYVGRRAAQQAEALPPIDLSGLNLGGVSLPADRVANAAYRAAPPNAPMPAPPPAQAPGQAPIPAPPPAQAPGNAPIPPPPPASAPGNAPLPAPPPASAPGNAPIPVPPPTDPVLRVQPTVAEQVSNVPPPYRAGPPRSADMPPPPPARAPGNAPLPAPPPAQAPGNAPIPPPPPASAPGNAPLPPPPPTNAVHRVQPTVTEQVANVPPPYQLLPLVRPNVDDFQELSWQDQARIAAQRGVNAIQGVPQTIADANDDILRQAVPDLYAPQPPVDQRVGSTTAPVQPSLRDRAAGGWDAIRGVPSAVGATTWEDVQRLAGRATEGAVGAVNTLNANSADNIIFGQDLTNKIEGGQAVIDRGTSGLADITSNAPRVGQTRKPTTADYPTSGNQMRAAYGLPPLPARETPAAGPTPSPDVLAGMPTTELQTALSGHPDAVSIENGIVYLAGVTDAQGNKIPVGYDNGSGFEIVGDDVGINEFWTAAEAAGHTRPGTTQQTSTGGQSPTPAQGGATQPTQSSQRQTSSAPSSSSSPARQSSTQSGSSGEYRSSSRQRGGSMDDMFAEDDDFGLNERDFTEKDYDGDGKISSKDRSIGRKRYQSELAKRRKRKGKSSSSTSTVPQREDTPIRRKVLSAIDASVNKKKPRR